MTIASAILESVKGINDGVSVRAGVICDLVNVQLSNHGEKRVSESSTKRKLRRLHICFSVGNTPNHPSDMRIMDRTGELKEAYEYAGKGE